MVGETLSHYRIVEELGRGGMGIVYKAEDLNLKRIVALKVLPPNVVASQIETARFRSEALAAAALNHPNIATVHDLGQTDDGQTFIVMEYVRGETLSDKIKRDPLTADETVRLALEMAKGSGAAHDAGIIHRDIKPGNMIVTERSTIKILDFGLAKVTDMSLSETGKRYGTVRYMSPEQARGERVDTRTDIWSIGAVLYEMLTGIRPFDAPYEAAILYAIINVDPVPPRGHNAEIPQVLEDIILRCLEKDASNRYQSASALEDDLRSVQRGSKTVAVADYRVTVTRRRTTRRVARILAPILAALLLLLAIPSLRYKIFPGLAPIPELRGLAVLPFINVGDDPDNQSIVDGLVHMVTAKLQGMERFKNSLWVVPSNEVFKLAVGTAHKAATELHVHVVVTGSVWLRGDRVQLTLALVDARTERSLRSTVIDELFEDVSAMQEGVVRHLAELLEIELLPVDEIGLTAGGTVVPGAYEYYLRGQGYLQLFENPNDVDLAITLFERAVDEDSTYALAIAGLGQAYWQKFIITNDRIWSDLAIEKVQLALVFNDNLSPVHVALGTILDETGQAEEAEKEFRRALELDETDGNAFAGLARALEHQNKIIDAEEAYRSAIRAKPDFWKFYTMLGIFYHSETRHEEAAQVFERVLELAPDYAFGYNNLASQYERIGRVAEADSLYVLATVVNLSSTRARTLAYRNLGVRRYAEDDFEEAIEYFSHSLGLDSTHVSSWADLGNSYHWLGRSEDAADAWHKVIELTSARLEVNPNSSSNLEALILAYAKLNSPDEATAAIEQMLSLQRVESKALISIGKAYEIMGDRQKALEFIGQGLDLGELVSDLEQSGWLDELRQDPRFKELLVKFQK